MPDGVTAVAELLTQAEMRLDFVMLNKEDQRWLIGAIDDWLFNPRGQGAASGLPL